MSSSQTHQLNREHALVELVDAVGHTIGQDTVATAHQAPGILHRAFSVMLFNNQERVLLQQRALTKKRFAGQWGPSCCGHPSSFENMEADATRRVDEELGLRVTGLQVIGHCQYFITSDGNQVEREYDHVLIGRCDATPHPDPGEVCAVQWVNPVDLEADIRANDGTYGEWLPPVLSVLFSWQKQQQRRQTV